MIERLFCRFAWRETFADLADAAGFVRVACRRCRRGCLIQGARLGQLFDEPWRQLALQGDVAAVKRLAAAVLQPLYGFCLYRVGRNQHLCEEVVQETMLKAMR